MPRPHLSDHQKLAQARAEIARLRKATAKAEPLTDATRSKLENDRLREALKVAIAAKLFTFPPSIEGHPISDTPTDRYGFGKAKMRKKARKKTRKKAPKKTRKKTRA
jgi:DNA-binding XRE family transcriptional regulator